MYCVSVLPDVMVVYAYVKNKAGLTSQTQTVPSVPGRRIPGHWPTPVPEALAVAEPVTLVSKTLPFSFLSPPEPLPRARAGQARPASGALEP